MKPRYGAVFLWPHAIAATRHRVKRAVVGLNLCPFAQETIRHAVSHARDADTLLDDLCGELQSVAAADAADCETTLLIHPQVFGGFLDFNNFLDVADATVEMLRLDGMLQMAGFHPHYQFAGSAPDGIGNLSHRSPHPTRHLLRGAGVERAMEAMSDTDAIYRRNIDALHRLGLAGRQALRDSDD
jgi:hypothetical protein